MRYSTELQQCKCIPIQNGKYWHCRYLCLFEDGSIFLWESQPNLQRNAWYHSYIICKTSENQWLFFWNKDNLKVRPLYCMHFLVNTRRLLSYYLSWLLKCNDWPWMMCPFYSQILVEPPTFKPVQVDVFPLCSWSLCISLCQVSKVNWMTWTN